MRILAVLFASVVAVFAAPAANADGASTAGPSNDANGATAPAAAPVVVWPKQSDRTDKWLMSESGRLRQGGTVIISVVIGTDGKTSEIKVFKSSGNDVLDEKVAHAMEHYLYIPGSINGQVVPMRILISWYIESSLGMAFPTILHP